MTDIMSQMFCLPITMAQVAINQLQGLLTQTGTTNYLWQDHATPSGPRQPGKVFDTTQRVMQSMIDPAMFRQSPRQPDGALGVEFPEVANGPVEQVLAFNNEERIKLTNYPAAPYFSSHGPLTDLRGNVLPGSRVETTFPVNPSSIDAATTWPSVQPPPFDRPPLDQTNTTGHGYSKQAYFFGDGSSFVTVGPSLPKIATLKNGGAQFWVGSIGVIAQGTGKYAGAKGVTTYVGSGYLPVWPKSFDQQAEVLQAGFRALVGTYVKAVLRENVACR